MKIQAQKSLRTDLQALPLWEKILLSSVFVLAYFLFSHPDLWETANHSYVLLESIFKGQFFQFYEVVATHENTYYYINNANYNIFVYLIFALWELPVFLVHEIFGFALNEAVLIYWAKLLSVGLYLGCGFLVWQIGVQLGLSRSKGQLAALLFLFHPIAFFSPLVMGQYDTLGLFFLLLAIWYYGKGNLLRFALLIGVSAACKFFAFLVFVPLLLLAEKRLLSLAKYAAASLWLLALSGAFFWGRTGNASAFTKQMTERLFALTTDTGAGRVSLFLLLFGVGCFFAYCHTPKNALAQGHMALYAATAVFGLLFLTVYWHPQWLVLLMPFWVLSTLCAKRPVPFFLLDIVLCAGFFLLCFARYPGQLGGILLDGGVLAHVLGLRLSSAPVFVPATHFLGLIPYLHTLMPALFTIPLCAGLLAKLPVAQGVLSDKLSSAPSTQVNFRLWGYAIFVIGFFGLWLAPSLFESLNAFGIV